MDISGLGPRPEQAAFSRLCHRDCSALNNLEELLLSPLLALLNLHHQASMMHLCPDCSGLLEHGENDVLLFSC